MFDVFQFLMMQFLAMFKKIAKHHANDVFARNIKMRKNLYWKKYFFLQIRYTKEIRADNYHFFVQKSAQYRHKILDVWFGWVQVDFTSLLKYSFLLKLLVCLFNLRIPKNVWFLNLKHRLKHRTFCLTMRCFSILNDAVF